MVGLTPSVSDLCWSVIMKRRFGLSFLAGPKEVAAKRPQREAAHIVDAVYRLVVIL